MSIPKRGLVGKPSRASLKSRGLATSNKSRQGSNSLSDGCYSLYSTDTEENVLGVNRGLDKCAELLTNILEIKSEAKDMKRSAHAVRKQRLKRPGTQKSAPSSKFGLTKPEQDVQKLKSKAAIHIPTGETKSNENVKKLKTTYNEGVVASTPVLTSKQRRQLLELQKRENSLQEQIQSLQEEYENLQRHDVMSTSPHTTKHKALSYDLNHDLQETKSSRRSLDFSNNAEKPLADNPQVQRNSPATKESSAQETSEEEKPKKVQFDSKTCESQATQNDTEDVPVHTNKSEPHNQPLLSHDSRSQTPKGGTEEESGNVYTKFQSPQRYSDHLRILAYLVGELRAVLPSSGENEVERLLNEIEGEIRLLTSYTVHSPRQSQRAKVKKWQHDIDTEIALQPLRSENSDLRRKLRIAHQRTREMEEQLKRPEEIRKEHPSEEGVIEHLHKQLFLEKENVRQLRQQNEQTEQLITERKKENSNLHDLIAEKDEELQNIRDELRKHKSKNMTDVDNHSKRKLESMEITVRAKNKEIGLLKLAIEQRDAEIGRLTELTRGLQQSLTRVLTNVQDLHPEDVLSDTSMLSGLDSWRPVKEQKLMPSRMVSTAARGYTHEPEKSIIDSDDELDVGKLETSNREYDNASSSVRQGTPYRREPVDQDSVDDDDTNLSVSSADEFAFKQELANLDTMIARLQQSLRSK